MGATLVKPNGRLTDDGARHVLSRRAAGGPMNTLAAIARDLGVSVGTVYNASSGRTHAWLHQDAAPEAGAG